MPNDAGRCQVEGCGGEPPAGHDACLAHVAEDVLGRHLRQAKSRGEAVDARNARIAAERVHAILAELGAGSGAVRVTVQFDGAEVDGPLKLAGLTLKAPVSFAGAEIESVEISQVSGLHNLRLDAPSARRTQIGELVLADCDAPQEQWILAEVDVKGKLEVRRSTFKYLGFDRVRVGGVCVVAHASIKGPVYVTQCAGRGVVFNNVQVAGGVTVDDLYAETLQLLSCTFDSWVDMLTCSSVFAIRCVFGGPTSIQWGSQRQVLAALGAGDLRRGKMSQGFQPPPEDSAFTTLSSIRFASTVHLRLAGADVSLAGCVFSDASTLSQADGASSLPRLVSVSEMDGDELRIGAVDVSSCQLAEAASLGPIDPFGLELGFGAVGFTHRRVLADEGERRSFTDGLKMTKQERRAQRIGAQQLTTAYRDLRRGNEEVGNHAGANDLYYGERLWERKASPLGHVNWLWLAAYGLVGYGVRPLRPFLWLVALVVAGAFAFGAVDGLNHERAVRGTPTDKIDLLCTRDGRAPTPESTQDVMCPASLAERLEFSVRTTTTLIRPVGGFQTQGTGIALDIALRLGAALLFTLFVLAVRNRVRR